MKLKFYVTLNDDIQENVYIFIVTVTELATKHLDETKNDETRCGSIIIRTVPGATIRSQNP